jgi:adenylate kinase family enzyme
MRCQAILLLGPTGSGKTPLGQLIEKRGFAGRRCHHFDFGRQLRLLAAGAGEVPPGAFSAADVDFVRGVLESGRLLEDSEFHFAGRLLAAFLQRCGARPDDILVLNGLPRHTGQAAMLETVADVRWLVNLVCEAETVLARIASNAGGDRGGRADDGPEAVRRRLGLFAERTAALVGRYAAAGAVVCTVPVGPRSRPEDVLVVLEEAARC